MSVRRTFFRKLAGLFSAVATKLVGIGIGYNAVDPRRKIIERLAMANRATANELLNSAGPGLRAYCRHLERNNPTARAAIEALKALVVGTGIALEPRGTASKAIRREWNEWIKHCGINGESLYELQTQAIAEKATTGEMLWRYVVLPDLAERGEIPLRILPLDSEWLVDQAPANDSRFTLVNGIEVDSFGRPVAYFLANPESTSPGRIERVEAKHINHRFERRRPLQNRGEPWMAPIIETLMNERDLVDVELFAAKMSAAPALVIESANAEEPDTTEHGTPEDPVVSGKLGSWIRLFPGEKFSAHSHSRPSQQIAPFRQMLRGDEAAAMRIPQRFLDRDVSRANYSSMKADQIDSERLLGPVREAHGHDTAGDAFRRVMPWLALRAGVTARAMDYELIPDETPYLDPQKDIGGVLLAIAGGLTTWEREIGKRGQDPQEVLARLKEEIRDPLLSQIFAANLRAVAPTAPAEEAPTQTAPAKESVDAE